MNVRSLIRPNVGNDDYLVGCKILIIEASEKINVQMKT